MANIISKFSTLSLNFSLKGPNNSQNAALNTAVQTPLFHTHLARCGGGAAVLGQFQHGPVALAAGGAVEAVWAVVVDPLMVAEVTS